MVATLSQRICLLVCLFSIAVTKLSALPTSSSLTQRLSSLQDDDEYFSENVPADADQEADTQCEKCVKETQQERLSDEEEMMFRIELFKMNILRKMNLREPPNISKLPQHFPRVPLTKIMSSDTQNDPVDKKRTESKKIERATILADKITSDLEFGETLTSVTFNIKTSTLRSYSEVVQAHVWVLLKPEELRGTSKIQVSSDIGGSVYYAEELDTPRADDEWLSVDLTNLMRRWVLQLNDSLENMTGTVHYTIRINVPTVAIGCVKDERPILIISGSQVVTKRVARNAVSCSGDSREPCCVQSLTVSFSEIGWGDWIVQPDSFSVNYCKGHCDDLNDALYNNTLALMGYTRQSNSLMISRCCVPSVLRPLKVIYLSDVTSSSGTPVVSEMTMDDMIIDECGCM